MLLFDDLWFGKYGGCFISDAFTLGCDRYYAQFSELAAKKDFELRLEELVAAYAPVTVSCTPKTSDNVTACHASWNAFALIGTALIGNLLRKKGACMGARYADEALLAAQVCHDLKLPLRLVLSKEIADIGTLSEQLALLGADVDASTCTELFNIPEMYAFQTWISDCDRLQLVNARVNCGAFPQVNIALACAQLYGKHILGRIGEYDRIVVPMVTGSTAASICAALPSDSLTTVIGVSCDTKPDLIEELDSFCGTFTKVMRNRTDDRVIAPYAAWAEDTGRLVHASIQPSDVNHSVKDPLNLQSRAALAWCTSHPADGSTLIIVGNMRWGTSI